MRKRHHRIAKLPALGAIVSLSVSYPGRYYIGPGFGWDALLFKLIGRGSDGSGFYFGSRKKDTTRRDHEWRMKRGEAKRWQRKLGNYGLPGLKVEVLPWESV
jgi:hypothetical protein